MDKFESFVKGGKVLPEKRKRLWIRITILAVLFSAVGYALYQNLNSSKDLKINAHAPDFTLTSIEGKKVSLKELKGKVVLVNFWGSWCDPCKREMPLIQSAYEKYKKQGFEVLAINVKESKFAVTSFLKQNQLNIPVLLNNDLKISKDYGVNKFPTNFMIDRDGKVKQIYEGEVTKDQLEGWINELL